MEKILSILLVEDNPADAHLIRETLMLASSEEYRMKWVASIDKIEEINLSQIFDVILFDLTVPGKDGIEIYSKLQQKYSNIPIIVLSGFHDEEKAISAVQKGAQDYIAKTQLSPYILSRSIRYAIERKQMEMELLRNRQFDTIGIIAGGIAHDFNNILTSIMGNISLIKDEINRYEQFDLYEMIEEAENATKRGRYLANQLLTFSKGGAPVRKNTDLFEIIQKTITNSLPGNPVRYIMDFDPNTWQVEIDSQQISQVVNNILINAAESMKLGGDIVIKTENADIDSQSGLPIKKGKYVKISIIDIGEGISPENIKRVFDPYFTTKPKSTGLGLTIAFSIIQRHEGFIEINSKLKEGTTVIFYLPVKSNTADNTSIQKKSIEHIQSDIPQLDTDIELSSTPNPQQNSKVMTKMGNSLNHPTIIIMDDEAGVRLVLSKMLSRIGYNVIETATGEDLIEKIEIRKKAFEPVDLLILDLTIPGHMGGKDAIKEIQKKFGKINAIVSSGYSNDPVMSNYRDFGFAGVLRKPFSLSALKQILNQFF